MPTQKFYWIATVLYVFGCVFAQGNDIRFELKEHFGHTWESDLVCRSFTAAPGDGLTPGNVQLLHNGKPVPMQLDRIVTYANGTIKSADIWFGSDLPANTSKTFLLRPAPANANQPGVASPVSVKKDGKRLVFDNGSVAVRIPAGEWFASAASTQTEAAAALAKHLGVPPMGEDAPGPILGIRLASGRWTKEARIRPFAPLTHFIEYAPQSLFQPVDATSPAGNILGYTTVVEADGPLVARVRITFLFANDGEYVTTIEVRGEEPLVRIDERYHNAGSLCIDMGTYAPTQAHYMLGVSSSGKKLDLAYEKETPRALLVGYNYYFANMGMAFGLTGDPNGDTVGLLSTDADWLPYPYNQGIHLVTEAGPRLSLRANLHNGHRHWAVLSQKAAFLEKEGEDPAQALVHWWQTHVAFPLAKVSAWTVEWAGMMEQSYPHLLFDSTDLPAIHKRLASHPSVQKLLAEAKTSNKKEFTAAAFYLATGDTTYLEKLQSNAPFALIDSFISAILDKRGLHFTPPHGAILGGQTDALSERLVAMDLLLGSDLLSAEQKKDILKRLAFLTYYLHDSHWLPPSYAFDASSLEPYKGYVQGTPNMKTCFTFVQAMLACLLKGHPAQADWIHYAIDENERVMPVTVHESGALLESPFYSSRDTMRWGPFWAALSRKGAPQETVDYWLARHKKSFRYLTDMLTPPEPRIGGRRVYHPIGRSSTGVVDVSFAMSGLPWGEADPEFAHRMCWAWTQQQKPDLYSWTNTGGRDLAWTLLGFNHNWTPLPAAPLKSERYEGMGAIFRSRVDTDHESNIVFRHDLFSWDLWPGNNGAVYFYGKGVPLMPRLGAYWNHKPWLMSYPFGNRLVFANDLVGETGFTNALGTMDDHALLGEVADYATGMTRANDWRRRVLFAKDLTKDDPAYLLVRDDVFDATQPNATHWWVLSKDVQPNGYDKPGVVPTHGYSDQQWLNKIGKNWKDAPQLRGQLQHFKGHFGVDMDLFIAWPTNPTIVTDAVGAEKMVYTPNPVIEIAQLVRIEQAPGKGHLALFVPRMEGSAQPTYKTIADGAGVAIQAGKENARLFLADEKIQFKDTLVEFAGTVGFVRKGGAVPLRLMVKNGRIASDGFVLECADAATLVYDGSTITVRTAGDSQALVQTPASLSEKSK